MKIILTNCPNLVFSNDRKHKYILMYAEDIF